MVADNGVVFDLGAAGDGYPSYIARYRFGAVRPSFAEVRRDPQPDLARSSGGALYYQFQRGWMRWNFGDSHPALTQFREPTPSLLDGENGRLLLSSREDCKETLAVRLPGRPGFALSAPTSTPVSPTAFGALCRQLTGFAWDRKRLVAAWSLIPSLSLQSQKDVGLAGIVIATNVPQ
jgi:hypothetical protein